MLYPLLVTLILQFHGISQKKYCCRTCRMFFLSTFPIGNVSYVSVQSSDILFRYDGQLNLNVRSPVSGTHARQFSTTKVYQEGDLFQHLFGITVTFDDFYNDMGMCSFCIQPTKFYSVPWQQPSPPPFKLFTTQWKNRGMASILYQFFLETSYKGLLLTDRAWKHDGPELDSDFDWKAIWVNIKEACCNPDHQKNNFYCIHRTYLTPRKLHCMKMINSPFYAFCVQYNGSLWCFLSYDVGLAPSLQVHV